MASISGINQSLAFLYHAMSIPVIFGEKMKREHGITSVDELLSQRLTLFELVGEKISTDASRLLASVDYILERQSCRDYHTLKKLFTCNEALKDSFEYFITRSVKTKGLCTERKLDVLPKAIFHPVGKAKKSRCNLPWVKEDNSAWKGIVVDRGDAEAMDKSSLLKHLGIDGSDSAWKLDDDLRMVFLSALPDEIRLPTALFRKLYKHQRDGIQWMSELKIEQMGGILGDEMGMGKTLQSLSFLFSLMMNRLVRNALIICPTATVNATWKNEATKLLPYFGKDCPIQVHTVTSEMPELQRTKILTAAKNCTEDKPTLIITPYSQFTRRAPPRGYRPFNKKEFDYVILDEGHKAKNKSSNTSTNIRKVIGKKSQIIIVTGTPLMNKLEELYCLLTLANGENLLGSWQVFRSDFVKKIEAARQRDASNYDIKVGSKVLAALQEKIGKYVLMRKRKDHLGDIVPQNHEYDVWTKLSPHQRELYRAFLQSDNELTRGIAVGDNRCVLPVIGKLRMLCGHPFLYSRENVLQRCQDAGVDDVIAMSPKLQVLLEILKKSAEEGKRTLVFSHFIGMLDIMEFVVPTIEGINACRIDGKTSPKRLSLLVDEFNKPESIYNVMLMSIKTGGEGLTLTGASKCVIYDPVWSQAESDQAVARICRPGQTQECESFCLIAAGTVEEKMYGKQVYKGDMARSVLGEGESNDGVFSLSDARLYNKNELSQLFELEPDGVCKTIERMGLSGVKNDPTKKGILTNVQAYTVGLTCRADIHNANKRKASSEEDAENGKNAEIPPQKSGHMEEISVQTTTVADNGISEAEARAESAAEPNVKKGNEEDGSPFII